MTTLGLFDALTDRPAIGRRQAGLLSKLGLNRVIDVIFFFPRDYEDFSEIRDISELEDSDSTSIIGEVSDFETVDSRGGRTAFYLLVEQDGHLVRAVWFNQPYRANRIEVGKKVMLSGKTQLKGLRYELMHPRLTILDDDQPTPVKGTLLPIYRLTEGVKQPELRRLVREIMDDHLEQVDEVFPPEFLEKKELLDIQSALRQVHFPETTADIEPARRRFVFQELLTLQLAIQLRKREVQKQLLTELKNSSLIDARIKKYFPYQLTAAQQKSIDEIASDMDRPVPMNRMLHGDVGCGKTSVAVYALLLAVANGHQGVLMAPTETLARQHFRNLQTGLATTQVNLALLTGSIGKKEKQELLEGVASGDVDVIVGTQALIQNEINFHKLGLIIVDEQHRFGVKQRASLRQQATTPHYLVMTATPIPRTVTMTLFGDLDVSVIDQKPPDRPGVNTYLCEESQKEQWWEFVRKKIREGRQAYVIAPLVEEDKQENWESVEATFENLANGEFADFKIDLVHGHQKPVEKEAAMQKFAEGQTQVLVATSVVEVGIDVPNATVMTILSASRFGLSQLHQLRGRVGRGKYAGYVTLFSDSEAEEATKRLQALVDIEDGFKLAEVDFQLRGPGDLFGTRQHGMPPLYVADLQRDYELLVDARDEARLILDSDPELTSPDFAEIRNRVMTRYGKTLELGDVG